ncbi:MAG TPA: type I DNA topoisomerase [Gemmatimonadales bacterium]|nr:type I DNA topoisomerase [Gemmatimonadales bacterium]
MATKKSTTKSAAKKSPARKAVRKSTRKKSAATAKSRARRTAAAVSVEEELPPAAPGETSLVIVESPAKAKTIGKYLGRDYRVKATVGHVIDLPPKKLGIDVEKGFEAEYEAIAGKEKTLAELKSAARNAREVLLATDPDREGEAIAWHVANHIRGRGGIAKATPVKRVLFREITRDAVRGAIDSAGEIDERKVEAQQARRLLDRLVGYKASPLLWKTVKKGLSAGRVQTVALRLIVERERDIRAFVPVEYWTIAALLSHEGQEFTAKLHHVDGKKPELPDEASANAVLRALEGRKTFTLTDVKRRERRKNPSAPFTTSTLQQEAAKKLGFGSRKTMRVAQGLYEGVEVGEADAAGLITYMRTDSTRIAESAADQAREALRRLFSAEYLASGRQLYGDSKKASTQDAHEAIRPTDPSRRPDTIRQYLTPDQFKLYQLVWQRFMASQMAPAVFDTTTLDFNVPGNGSSFLFRSTGSIVKFDGFLALYREGREEEDGKALEDEQALPSVEKGTDVPVKSITPTQHFTEPPPRFSEASLVKELEKLGIGRPSTYASIITVLVDRRYVSLEQRRFFPTELGESVEKVMVQQFPNTFNVGFTSEMESELDRVEEGSIGWQDVLDGFWSPFNTALSTVDYPALIAQAHDISALDTERCPECGGKLVAKGGFFGPYIACENHPKNCSFTRPLKGDRKQAELTDYKCPECGAPMYKRSGRTGDFLGCSRFPKCKGTRSMPTGVMCPKDGGEITERRSKRGKPFYGCENYPDCDFVVWDRPVAEKCPECGNIGAAAKSTKARGEYRRCLKCENEWEVAGAEEEVA